MLNDRNKMKRVVKVLRYAAKHGKTLKFKTDHDQPQIFDLEYSKDVIVLNPVYLYKQAHKVPKET